MRGKEWHLFNEQMINPSGHNNKESEVEVELRGIEIINMLNQI
jgi:hypothetical protein